MVPDLLEPKNPTRVLYAWFLFTRFSAASSGPAAPSMFDEEDDGAAADALEEEDAAGSDDDAFVVAKPQVSHSAACVKKTKRTSHCALCET